MPEPHRLKNEVERKKNTQKLNWKLEKTITKNCKNTNCLSIARLVLKSQANKTQKRTENGVCCVYNIMFMMINLRICFDCANCESEVCATCFIRRQQKQNNLNPRKISVRDENGVCVSVCAYCV